MPAAQAVLYPLSEINDKQVTIARKLGGVEQKSLVSRLQPSQRA